MSKVLVDPAALEEAAKWLEVHSSSSGSAEAFAAEALREAIAQPAEAGRPGDWEWLKLMAEVAEQDRPWDPRLGMTDVEMAYAQSASPSKVLELIAALSSVTAERDMLRGTVEATYNEWLDKTEWVQKTAKAHELGKHRADVLKERVDKLQSEVESLRKDAAAGAVVWKFIDRMADPAECDPAEDILAEFVAAFDAAMAAKEA